nr:hypothetical protein [Saccharospirillum impatiens]
MIPRGQFGFILTNEFVKVPGDPIAFISFKASYKFRGLINVSGFHVDPGWEGRLIFSVYNAGPSDITLKLHDNFALIWYSDLDRYSSDEFQKKSKQKQESISSGLINNISGGVVSPPRLKADIDALEKKLDDKVREIETSHIKFRFHIGIAALGIFFAFILIVFSIAAREPIAEFFDAIFDGTEEHTNEMGS